jgi:hypothetical protein
VELAGWETLRTQCAQRLLRMKVLDDARLLGGPVLLIDGSGLLCFHQRHCEHCLVRRHGNRTLYMHQVLEAKLLGPAGVVVSIGSEFIDNHDASGPRGRSAEEIKQDCEMKAMLRLAESVKKAFPQAHFILSVDSLHACGPLFELCRRMNWSFVATFKEGRTPGLWREYDSLRAQCPENVLKREWAGGLQQEFRWVSSLDYEDSAKRSWRLNVLECTERKPGEDDRYFAWVTDLVVLRKTVEEIAQKGGRYRWKIENEGFNRQKNSGLNLEHVITLDPENWKSYYVLLQSAFILVQLVERGSLLRRLAEECGQVWRKLFGSLKNIARRLLDSVRFVPWDASWFDAKAARKNRIRLDSS